MLRSILLIAMTAGISQTGFSGMERLGNDTFDDEAKELCVNYYNNDFRNLNCVFEVEAKFKDSVYRATKLSRRQVPQWDIAAFEDLTVCFDVSASLQLRTPAGEIIEGVEWELLPLSIHSSETCSEI